MYFHKFYFLFVRYYIVFLENSNDAITVMAVVRYLPMNKGFLCNIIGCHWRVLDIITLDLFKYYVSTLRRQ